MHAIPIPGFSEPFSSITHLCAAFLYFIGMFFLISKGKGNVARMTSLMIFSFSLVFLFSMSGVYHLLEPGGVPRDVLRRLDHTAIWALIAGTFTPMHVILFRGVWRWGILVLVWVVAITGQTLEAIFLTELPESLILFFFLALGWLGALSGFMFRRSYQQDRSVHLLLFGGVSYSVGAMIDFLRWPTLIPGVIASHEIFHLFVILGSFFHWLFIYRWAHYPVGDKITFHVTVYPTARYVARAQGEKLSLEATSIDDLKRDIRTKVSEIFHPRVHQVIRLRYFKEEHL